MSKTPIFLQNGSSTLYDLSLQNVMARLAKKYICFIDVSYQYLELTKSLKKPNSMLLQNELAHQILTK